MTSKIKPIKNLTKPAVIEEEEEMGEREEEKKENDKIILGRKSLGCC